MQSFILQTSYNDSSTIHTCKTEGISSASADLLTLGREFGVCLSRGPLRHQVSRQVQKRWRNAFRSGLLRHQRFSGRCRRAGPYTISRSCGLIIYPRGGDRNAFQLRSPACWQFLKPHLMLASNQLAAHLALARHASALFSLLSTACPWFWRRKWRF